MSGIPQLASAIAKVEGKKKQARIGEVREILKIVATMHADVSDNMEGVSPLLIIQEYANEILAKRVKARLKKK